MSIEKIRFLDNNLVSQAVSVVSDTDYDAKDVTGVLDAYDFGLYRLTENGTLGGYVFDIELFANLEPSCFAIVPSDVTRFFLTSETEVVLQASNSGFDNIEKEFTGVFSRFGAFVNIREAGVDNAYRYWRVWIKEFNRDPGEINESLDIKYFYLGDHVQIDTRNIAKGIGVFNEDKSSILIAESGRRFANLKQSQLKINNLKFQAMSGSDRANFQRFYQTVGKVENFLCIPDPGDATSAEPLELMRVMHFEKPPMQKHIVRDLFDQDFTLVEAV